MNHLPDFETTPIEEIGLPEHASSFVDRTVLPRGGSVFIDTDPGKSLVTEDDAFYDEIEELIGERPRVIARVGIGGDMRNQEVRDGQFLLFDTQQSERFASPYLLLKEEDGKAEYKGVWRDKPTVVGRGAQHKNRFTLPRSMSNSHFELMVSEDETIRLTDLDSTNYTAVTGFLVSDEMDPAFKKLTKDPIYSHFTEDLRESARRLSGFESPIEVDASETPYGTLKGFKIIGRESPSVSGGVYGTISPNSEFVLVNDTSPQITSLKRQLAHELRFNRDHFKPDSREILDEVRAITAATMRYDLDAVEHMSRPHFENQGIIMLTDYIDAGVGVCRQQALLAASLLEYLQDEGFLSGASHVERNHDREAHGAHAWAVYTQPGEEDVIVDPAQDFIGTREEAAKAGRWRYYVTD